MKKRRIFGFFIAIICMILTSCSGNDDGSQYYQVDIQSSVEGLPSTVYMEISAEGSVDEYFAEYMLAKAADAGISLPGDIVHSVKKINRAQLIKQYQENTTTENELPFVLVDENGIREEAAPQE